MRGYGVKMSLVLSQLTPSPAPVVTVTETVIATPPAPIINVQVPPDGWDWWHDVFWGDFGGAVFGVIGALAAAWYGTRLMSRADRRAREEESRRLVAAEYADAARRLSKDLNIAAFADGTYQDALERFEVLTGRLVRQYSDNPDHKRFATWTAVRGQPVGIRLEPLRWALSDTLTAEKLTEIKRSLSEISTDLRVIEHTALEWLRDPRNWKPDMSAREAHDQVKRMLSPLNDDEPTAEQP